MHFQWYPGHMSKAKRQMQEDLKLIDVVIELVDARIPYSSKNPDIDYLAKEKARIILMNKYDLADPAVTDQWRAYYEKKGWFVAMVNSKSGNGVKNVHDVILQACKDKTERDMKRGIMNRPIRAMIVGIPNVGKSTFINSFAGKAVAKTGNKPGVTKGKQWIRLNKNVELLDTPGILWPKFEDQRVGMRIAFIGSINDEILVSTDLAYELSNYITSNYPGALSKKYEIEEDKDGVVMLEHIADKRACLLRGGRYDIEKASGFLLDDFRNGRISRISLETPAMIEKEIKERKEEEKKNPVKKTAQEKSAESLAKRQKKLEAEGKLNKTGRTDRSGKSYGGKTSDRAGKSFDKPAKSTSKANSQYYEDLAYAEYKKETAAPKKIGEASKGNGRTAFGAPKKNDRNAKFAGRTTDKSSGRGKESQRSAGRPTGKTSGRTAGKTAGRTTKKR